ncbi:Undecaprenyl phosphate-alpha-4-amino-4-deoxy-L-arabinose arabinosyl transferase [Commensalibacter sp. Nvir]|uniref:ArnT family glycosyltransferase n=1 Tax=Commensalibacter sp. Nvir TaxID=3069817 RepID=UPI002D26273A|nr:Undecaprenyl phosphate-alpha-4-amino-4-deoxy-L-arabinose arabinosyl transferase [Commensalibacter sp. Nvir]
MTPFKTADKNFHLKPGHYLWLALFIFMLFVPGRASLPPLDRDEARYMQATSQMIESKNYIDVRFQDKPRYLQPVGIYWLEALAVNMTRTAQDKAVWAYRLPSLFAAVGSVLVTVWIGSILFDSYIGLLAGLLLAVSVLLTAEGRMATIDTCLLFCILLAQSSLARAWVARSQKQKLPLSVPLIYWIAIGSGLMLKGPVVLIPTFLTPISLAWISKNKTWWKHLRLGWGWLIPFVMTLPWCIAIWHISHGQFFGDAIGNNFVGKITSGQQAHGLLPGYYLAIFLVSFWPGSLFTAWCLPYIWKKRKVASFEFLLCWVIPHWIIFEAIATKLPHYVLPTYPAIAILTSASLWNISEDWIGPISKWGKGLFNLYMGLWCVVGLSLTLGSIYCTHYMTGVWINSAFIGAFAVSILIVYTIYYIFQHNVQRACLTAIGSAIVLYIEIFVVLLPCLHSEWLSNKIAQTVNLAKPCKSSVLASASYSEPSLVFLLGKNTQLLNAERSADFLKKNSSCGLVLINHKDRNQFLNKLNKPVVKIAQIQGLNYSSGKKLNLELYKVK